MPEMGKLIAANWKMNLGAHDAAVFAEELKKLAKGNDKCDILICPPFTALHYLAGIIKGSGIMLGAQNMHYENSGAYTGEISPSMLVSAGCTHVILGHSERREFFREDDMLINRKVHAALKAGLKPILCVGETLEQREKNWTQQVLEKQLSNCLHGISRNDMKNLVIAYEPVWAISRGNANVPAATPDDAKSAHDFIRHVVSDMLGHDAAEQLRILYGGSMKPENAKTLLSVKGIDGGLVGNASLNAKSFAEVIGNA
jgi:triosephosphate isomerase (TIM)